jgi:hypothetical protein
MSRIIIAACLGMALIAMLVISAGSASRVIAQDDPPWGRSEQPRTVTPQDGPQDLSPDAYRRQPRSYDDGPPPPQTYDDGYRPPGGPYGPPRADGPPPPPEEDSFSVSEISDAGGRFFGSISMGLAKVIEYTFQKAGRPNGYILGEEAGGAFIAGLRYGEGTLYTKDYGEHKVYWQGPSIGYDFGAEGSKTMVLVYNLHNLNQMYQTYGGVDGSAYFIGGVGVTFQTRDNVTLAPIRSGIGLRLGANVGYLKYTREPTWNPF